jgi:hypothetical protein
MELSTITAGLLAYVDNYFTQISMPMSMRARKTLAIALCPELGDCRCQCHEGGSVRQKLAEIREMQNKCVHMSSIFVLRSRISSPTTTTAGGGCDLLRSWFEDESTYPWFTDQWEIRSWQVETLHKSLIQVNMTTAFGAASNHFAHCRWDLFLRVRGQAHESDVGVWTAFYCDVTGK